MGHHRDTLVDATATGDGVLLNGLIVTPDGDGGFHLKTPDTTPSGFTEDGPREALGDYDNYAAN